MEKAVDFCFRKGKAVGETKPTERGDCTFEVTVSPDETGETPDGRGTVSVSSKVQQEFVRFFLIYANFWEIFFYLSQMAQNDSKKAASKETAFDCGSEEAGDFVVGDAALTGDYLREARNRCFRPKSCISRPISSSLARKRMLSSRPKAKRIRR